MGWQSKLESLIASVLVYVNGFATIMIVIVIAMLNIIAHGGGIGPSWNDYKYDLHVDGLEKLKKIVSTLLYTDPELFNKLLIFGFLSASLCAVGWNGVRTQNIILVIVYGFFTIMIAVGYILITLNQSIYLKLDIWKPYEEYIKTKMWKQFDIYDPTFSIFDFNGRNRNKNVIDSLQQMLQCCGVVSYEDWRNATQLSLKGSVPDSCCVKFEPDCGFNYFNKPQDGLIYTEGCYQEGRDFIMNLVIWPWPLCIASAVIQLLCGTGAIYICRVNSDWAKENECIIIKKEG